MKIVINKCFGGFGLSQKVMSELGIYNEYGYVYNKDFNINSYNPYAYRTNQKLIKTIEKIGLKESSNRFAELVIVDIPDDIQWEIDDYDGMETVREPHRSW